MENNFSWTRNLFDKECNAGSSIKLEITTLKKVT